MPHCPECEAVVDVAEDEVEEGEVLSCPECGVDLEIVGTNPIELNLLDDEDDEEEEDEEEELIANDGDADFEDEDEEEEDDEEE